jgi:HD-GYP domain-containing protein (c-di-GMP phosphodiesterase class II)
VTTRFQTRTFLLCFVPFAILMAGSFWMVQRFVQSTVREGLHNSLRESQVAIATIHAKGDLQNSRFLRIAGENVALKAGMQLLLSDSDSSGARRTVEDQLRELGEHMGFDFMLISAPDGTPLAGVVRQSGPDPGSHGQLVPLDTGLLYHSDAGFRVLAGRTFQVASVPIDENNDNIGILSVGEYFNLSDLTTPVVLVHAGRVVESNIPQVPFDELERALIHCSDQAECDVSLQGSNWISLPMQSYGGGYVLLSFENIDKATAPIQSRLHSLFLTLSFFSFLIAFLASIASSNTIVKPIAVVVSHLRTTASTGVLSELEEQSSSIQEIRELAEFYNRAALSVRASSDNLQSAYLEFVGSLANALDARDRYTAGHSWRVSQLSCAIASAMQLAPADFDRLRIGALLHDIGKIGVEDYVLQKPGRLTSEEFELVKQHPVIGRRILEGVQGFAPFLAAVELHHENWDGSGYPHGQAGEQTPLDARIIHVADAYDAMTTHRSYRRGLTHQQAVAELIRFAGVQFDPRIVEVFVTLPEDVLAAHSSQLESVAGLREPAVAVVE